MMPRVTLNILVLEGLVSCNYCMMPRVTPSIPVLEGVTGSEKVYHLS